MKHQDFVRGTIMALSVLALPMLSASAQAAERPADPKADCTCAAAFERLAERTETGYVAFSIKVDAERREAYKSFKAILRKDAAGAGVARCQEVLKTYVAFFQDHHLFVLGNSEAGGVKEAARPWTEAEARAELDRHRERLDPVEGLWYSRGGRFAVLHEPGSPAGTFAAVRLAKDGTPSREMAAVLRRIAHGSYRIGSWDAQGKWQTSVAGLYRGGALLGFSAQSWGRLHPEVPESRLDPVDPMAPLFTRLNAKTLYLSLPSFFGEYEQPLNQLLETRGAEIGKADSLIIDLRGNGGGNAIYDGLVPYLFSGPFQYREANLILASPDNLQWLEEARKGNNILDSPSPIGDNGAGGSRGGTLPPWVGPRRLISLWEIMERFEPNVLLIATSLLETWTTGSEKQIPGTAQKTLKFFAGECRELGLTYTLKTVNRALQLVSLPSPPIEEFRALCSEILGRLRDELESVHLMVMSVKEASYYNNWWDRWSDVTTRFPSVSDDVEEASKSLACGRGTACVFHLMRVMEHGLQAVAKAMGIPYAPSWESYLKQIKVRLDQDWKDKEPEWKKQEPFFRDTLAFLQGVKIAWRNPTMHIVNHYTPEQAEDILNNVRAFMNHIATKLGEDSILDP